MAETVIGPAPGSPAPPDGRVWRIVGDPLLSGAAVGPLAGETIAVKDVFAVRGFAIGAGVPDRLAEAPLEPASAPAVEALLAAGASVRGIARTDQFAYSIAGRNAAYGTPPNGAVPGAIPGGSTSGPAAAVALGEASIGIGTDTAGSIRVPASYQGLWGLRTTHGLVSRLGVLPLAPSFDTVGWLARDPGILLAAARASIDGGAAPSPRFVVWRALAAAAHPAVARAFGRAIERLAAAELAGSGGVAIEEVAPEVDLDELYTAFRTVQAAEAWRAHGDWVAAHPGALGADVAARFEWAATVTPELEHAARARLAVASERLDTALGDAVLLVPSAASVAPSLAAAGDAIEAVRAATLRMTAVAGVTGRPALSAPLLVVPPVADAPADDPFALGGPVGLCLVGPRGRDLALLEFGARLRAALR